MTKTFGIRIDDSFLPPLEFIVDQIAHQIKRETDYEFDTIKVMVSKNLKKRKIHSQNVTYYYVDIPTNVLIESGFDII